jgi:hypothetical protein
LDVLRRICGAVILTASSAWAAGADFVKDVQPIFDANCIACHGAKMQMGGLRLDAKTAAFTGGVSGSPIRSGNADQSLLIQRVKGVGERPRMPMGGKPLPAEQVAVLTEWIEKGANWPDGVGAVPAPVKKHWAFVAPVRPAVPAVTDKAWVKTPVDAFVLARLEREKLAPSPVADRATLLRRLSLDLIGLPPTPAELNAFVNDKSPRAYEKQVERLLASPHYGERWARIWLDAARYADSDGYEKDLPREVWFYRDWVINSFNRDLPYDQFVIDQIAGDLLPNATQEQRVATGFLRNSMINEEGGVDPEQFRTEALIDRMDAIGKGILGVTIQCAQCHNHKYDPLKQEEYYKMFAFLNDSYEGSVPVYTPADLMKRDQTLRGIREAEEWLQHRTPDWAERMAKWEASVKDNQPEWRVFQPVVDDISTGGERYLPQSDGSFLALGYAPSKKRIKMTIKLDAPRITALRLELMTDKNLPRGGPGRDPRGIAALSEFEVEAAPADAPKESKPVKIVGATADFNMPVTPLVIVNDTQKPVAGLREGPVEYAIDGKPETAWATDAGPGRRNQPHQAVFTFAEPIENAKGTVLTVYLRQDHGAGSDRKENPNLGRMRLSWTDAVNAAADPVPAGVRKILAKAAAERSPAEVQTVFRYWRTTVPEFSATNDKIEELWRSYPEGSSQLVLQTKEQPRDTHMLMRGDWLQPGAAVTPGVPAFLNPLPAYAPPNRLTFARWMVDRQAPTTARSLVNRIWQAYFGTGIVSTSENLGTQADVPSHPELLDWLAVDFMDHGWSIKSVQRKIVLSAAYRQNSNVTPELLAKDPDNRLLARGARFRVDAEIVRDIALAASGLLNLDVGGPSVFPPAPAFLFLPPTSYSPKPWTESTGAERYRRAVYTFRYRSVPYPVLQTFDAPNGDASCVRRARSNTPLQALATLNEPLFVDAARALALRTLEMPKQSDEQRLDNVFRRVLSRTPKPPERAELLALLAEQTEYYKRAPDQAGQLTSGAASPQWAAWTIVSRVVLNLDEAVSKE